MNNSRVNTKESANCNPLPLKVTPLLLLLHGLIDDPARPGTLHLITTPHHPPLHHTVARLLDLHHQRLKLLIDPMRDKHTHCVVAPAYQHIPCEYGLPLPRKERRVL